jgi:hypothetical protein
MEKAFLRTLALIKSEDPAKLRDKKLKLYEEAEAAAAAASDDEEGEKKKKEKPVYLKDHQRQRLLTRGDQAFVSDSEDDEAEPPAPKDESYNEQQERLKKAFHVDCALRVGMHCCAAAVGVYFAFRLCHTLPWHLSRPFFLCHLHVQRTRVTTVALVGCSNRAACPKRIRRKWTRTTWNGSRARRARP